MRTELIEVSSEEQLAKELKSMWKSQKISNHEIARMLNITPKTLTEKIHGRAHYKADEIIRIIQSLGFKLYLVRREDDVK